MATTNRNRFFKSVTPTLSALTADATANRTAINNALVAAKGTDTGVYLPSGSWPYNGTIMIDGATLYGEADSILVGNDGTASPSVAIELRGVNPRALWFTQQITGATVRASNLVNCGFFMNTTAKGGLIKQVTSSGAASSGFFSFGSTSSRMDNAINNGSLADGNHWTFGSTLGECSGCQSNNVGDDYFAVVSYNGEVICSGLLFTNFAGSNQQLNGRGLTVVGGNNVIFRKGTVVNVWQRGIYITSEVAYNTLGVDGVVLADITVTNCGLAPGFNADPGAAGVWVGGRVGFPVTNVSTSNVRITGATGPLTLNTGDTTSNISFAGVSA